MAMVDECCAKSGSDESRNWALVHFGEAKLGDKRRTRRLVQLAAAITEDPSRSLPKQLPAWSDLIGAYRLLSNAQVDPQAILQPHLAWTLQQAQGCPVVLCVQDDTQLDFGGRSGMRGLGIIGDGRGQGLVQHGALAVLPDKRLLGILDLRWFAAEKTPDGEPRRARQKRWTTRDVWPEAIEHIGSWPVGVQLIHVGDRAADLYRFMHTAKNMGHGFVVRAMHDRTVDGTAEHLWEKLPRQPRLGSMCVTLGKQGDGKGLRAGRDGRSAELTIRAAPIQVAPPAADPRTKGAVSLELWAVYLVEEHPPKDIEPVEWMLITSLEVKTLAQAQTIIGYYTCRWVIEEWHRCLKEGCRIEASQLDDGRDIQRLGAVLAIVAVRLLQMRDLADAQTPAADAPETLRELVPPLYVTLVAGLAKCVPELLTPRLFWRTIAKRGGYLDRKRDPRPGWKVLWRGWSDVVQMVRGVELYQRIMKGGITSV